MKNELEPLNGYKLEKVLVKREHKTIYLDGKYVIKVMDENYPAADVLSEAHRLASVGGTGIRVPRLLEVTQIDGKWAIVWEYIPGTTMSAKLGKESVIEKAALNLFVDLQIKLNNETASRLPPLKEKMQRKLKAIGEIEEAGKPLLDAAACYELLTRLDSMANKTNLCHGDFVPSNVLLTKDSGNVEDAAVIDFSHASQGDAAADAAQTCMLFSLAEKDELAVSYLRLYCEKSNIPRQLVEKWFPIVAAAHLTRVSGEKRDFLLRWTDVAEYQ
jgi:Ser/Thr protein kinase RdoA (MazF antagonist)